MKLNLYQCDICGAMTQLPMHTIRIPKPVTSLTIATQQGKDYDLCINCVEMLAKLFSQPKFKWVIEGMPFGENEWKQYAGPFSTKELTEKRVDDLYREYPDTVFRMLKSVTLESSFIED